MVDEILGEIQDKAEREQRSPMELYMEVLMTGSKILKSRDLSRDQVVDMCSVLITLYVKSHEA